MNGKGKRLGIHVRPVLATELEVIPESLEVDAQSPSMGPRRTSSGQKDLSPFFYKNTHVCVKYIYRK